MFLTFTVARDSRKLKIQKLQPRMEYKSLVSPVIPWVCQASGTSHHAQEVSSHTWAVSLFGFSCRQSPSMQPWIGNSWIQVWLLSHWSTALASPWFPCLPSLKLSDSVGETVSWMVPTPCPFSFLTFLQLCLWVRLLSAHGLPHWPDDKMLRAATQHPEQCPRSWSWSQSSFVS